MPAVSEINNFLSREAWIPNKRSKIKAKGSKLVPVKWAFKSKEVPDG